MGNAWKWINGTRWRQVLVLFIACLIFTTLWAQAGQARLADHVIRIHVLANSDSEEDQSLKRKVRDEVLPAAEACVARCNSREEAEQALRDAIPRLTRTAEDTIRENGFRCPVRLTLGNVWYDTRSYGLLSFPAGEYESLRVIIGDGEGHNWWGVLFPSLCLPAVTETAVPAMGQTGNDFALISEEAPIYRVKFRTAELLSTFWHRFQKDSSCAHGETVID